MAIDAAVLADPASFMELALDAAAGAELAGDLPIGAVAVHHGSVIASAGNRRAIDNDPTAHAEVLVLQAAAELLGTWRLTDVTVVVTLEPCPMCAGALWAARAGGVVFGAADMKAGATGSLYNLGADPRLNHEFDVLAGVMAEQCAHRLTAFFASRRPNAS